MIVGIGNDIIEIKRFENIIQNVHFIKKYYTKREADAANGHPSFFAANFSVKESVAKAFGTGFRGFELSEIEVLRDELGKPYVILHGMAKAKADELEVDKIFVSISDTKEIIMTTAVAEKKE